MFRMRRAESSDAATVGAMMRLLWPTEDPAAFDDDLEALHGHLTDLGPAAIFVAVADADGGPMGFVSVGTRPWSEGVPECPVGYVAGWYVAATWRRLGVGRALLDAAEQWSRDQGYAVIASDTEQRNAVSIAAHLATGYREAERIVYFAKTLQAPAACSALVTHPSPESQTPPADSWPCPLRWHCRPAAWCRHPPVLRAESPPHPCRSDACARHRHGRRST